MEQNYSPLNIQVTRAVVNGAMYDVMDYTEYVKNKNGSTAGIAVETEYKGNTIILPVRGKYNNPTNVPGIYSCGPLDFFVYPSDNSIQEYLPQKMVKFGNMDSMKEILEKEETLSRMAEPWITSPDNITQLSISADDQPEMRCLKMAINEKNVDFDKYAPRFGANFPNDKRQLKNKSATLNIIKRFCDNMDMSCDIILKDKNPNVANPMNKEIRVSLTDVLYDENE